MKKSELQKKLRDIEKVIIPALQNEKEKARVLLSDAQKEFNNIENKIRKHEQEACSILIKLQPKAKDKPTLSDHALIRYLERAKGFDLNCFRDEILDTTTVSAIKSGAKSIKKGGVTFIVEDNVLVTVV